MPRVPKHLQRDRAGTWRVEVEVPCRTWVWGISTKSEPTLIAETKVWALARDGCTELEAHGFAKRIRAQGETARVITHESWLLEEEAAKLARRKDAARRGAETRKRRRQGG